MKKKHNRIRALVAQMRVAEEFRDWSTYWQLAHGLRLAWFSRHSK